MKKSREIRHEDEKRRQAFKAAAPISAPIPYVTVFTSAMKLKPSPTRFGKRKVVV